MLATEPEKRERRTATIESLADDQGGGLSWCSNCSTHLDDYTTKHTQEVIRAAQLRISEIAAARGTLWQEVAKKPVKDIPMECPGCNYQLKYGEPPRPYEFGGSDFD